MRIPRVAVDMTLRRGADGNVIPAMPKNPFARERNLVDLMLDTVATVDHQKHCHDTSLLVKSRSTPSL